MFSYLRYFAAISLVLVVLAAVVVGILFKEMNAEDLHDIVKSNNEALAQGFVNAVWKDYNDTLIRLAGQPRQRWRSNIDFITFSQQSFKFFEDMPIAKVSIYSTGGNLLFSSDQTKILTLANKTIPGEGQFGFTDALQGRPVSRVIEDAGFGTASGLSVEGTLVHTLVPIISDNYVEIISGEQPAQIEGIIEILFDVSEAWDQLFYFQIFTTGGIIVIFIVLIAILILTSFKAESIIAKQHEVNLELTAAAASAEAENRDKSQFLANISHELRTPLNAIIGFSEIIKQDGATLTDTHKGYINDINSSGTHLLSLINDILDYSKAEAGKLELELAEIDATKVIKNCMRLVMTRAEEQQVTLVEELPSEHIVMITDAKKLKQSLLNLLSNAVKFTSAGGEVKVTAWQNVVDDSISIEVRDTGIGIAPKDISRVMTPFGQVDSTLARKHEGTGLGLPLSKKFIESMGGIFTIESEVGVGTSISMKLPREVDEKLAKPKSSK